MQLTFEQNENIHTRSADFLPNQGGNSLVVLISNPECASSRCKVMHDDARAGQEQETADDRDFNNRAGPLAPADGGTAEGFGLMADTSCSRSPH